MSAKFGPAGNSDSFVSLKQNTCLEVPSYLLNLGLSAYEYQCGRGVNIGSLKATQFGEIAKEHAIQISLHAPYYISLSSVEEEKRNNSLKYILDSANTVNLMHGDRIIVHSGSCSKMSRAEALQLASATMKKALDLLDMEGLSHIRVCPETMGKINQLGTLDEVITLCEIDERMIPCIDFGHLNARSCGGLKTYSDFEAIFLTIENKLGESRLKEFHSHFSKIEYSKGGEVRHLTFSDTEYGPDFEYIAELSIKKNCSPVFICESAGTQADDAVKMRTVFEGMSKL